ncbi:hypothetical protein B0H19DRAFT_1245686 [Mycena capillaripes]|nr:hypothetical protein B0H19DRAFT_1245686 [Mycena capillaripes]
MADEKMPQTQGFGCIYLVRYLPRAENYFASNIEFMIYEHRVCEVGHAVGIGHTLYKYTILDYGHPERLSGPFPPSLAVIVFLSGIISACGKFLYFMEAFFAFRIYVLSKKPYIPTVVLALALVRLLGCTVIFVMALRAPSVQSYEVHWGWLSTTMWSIGAANDLMTTTTLVSLLYKQRVYAQKRTAALMDKLILWTIGTFLMHLTLYLTLSPSLTVSFNEAELYLGRHVYCPFAM